MWWYIWKALAVWQESAVSIFRSGLSFRTFGTGLMMSAIVMMMYGSNGQNSFDGDQVLSVTLT